MLYICTKFCENPSYLVDMIFTLKFTKGHSSVNTVDGLAFCNCLIMFNTCTKFHKISQRLLELLSRVNFTLKFTKGHNSVKNINRDTEHFFCMSSDHI